MRRVRFIHAWRRVAGCAAVVALLVTSAARAEDVPVKIQAIVFRKILLYDRTIPGAPRVLVAFVDEVAEADAMVRAYTSIGVEASAVRVSALASSLTGVSAVYLFPKAINAATKDLLSRERILSLGGSAVLAERGDVAVGIGTKDGRAEIVVNLHVLRIEGHDLASDLLNLARVIR